MIDPKPTDTSDDPTEEDFAETAEYFASLPGYDPDREYEEAEEENEDDTD